MDEARLKGLWACAPGVEWGLVVQVWERDVFATDEALSNLKGERAAGKRGERG